MSNDLISPFIDLIINVLIIALSGAPLCSLYPNERSRIRGVKLGSFNISCIQVDKCLVPLGLPAELPDWPLFQGFRLL